MRIAKRCGGLPFILAACLAAGSGCKDTGEPEPGGRPARALRQAQDAGVVSSSNGARAARPDVKDTGDVDRFFVCVMDCSASMKTNDRKRFAEQGTQLAVALLGKGTSFGAVAFNSAAWVQARLRKVESNEDRRSLQKMVAKIPRMSDTNFVAALRATRVHLARRLRRGASGAVVFLTDGRARAGAGERLMREVRFFKKARWPIYTIGLSEDADADLLQDMAARTGGAYFKAATADKLLSAFVEVVAATESLLVKRGGFKAATVPPGTKRLVYLIARDGPDAEIYSVNLAGGLPGSRAMFQYPEKADPDAAVEVRAYDGPSEGVWSAETRGSVGEWITLIEPPFAFEFAPDRPRARYVSGQRMTLTLLAEGARAEVAAKLRDIAEVGAELKSESTDKVYDKVPMEAVVLRPIEVPIEVLIEVPSEAPPGEAPDEGTAEAVGEEPSGEAPGEEPSSEAPGEEPSSEAPGEEPSGEAPGEEPSGEAAGEDPSGEAPEGKADEKPDEKPDEKADEKPDEKPAKEPEETFDEEPEEPFLAFEGSAVAELKRPERGETLTARVRCDLTWSPDETWTQEKFVSFRVVPAADLFEVKPPGLDFGTVWSDTKHVVAALAVENRAGPAKILASSDMPELSFDPAEMPFADDSADEVLVRFTPSAEDGGGEKRGEIRIAFDYGDVSGKVLEESVKVYARVVEFEGGDVEISADEPGTDVSHPLPHKAIPEVPLTFELSPLKCVRLGPDAPAGGTGKAVPLAFEVTEPPVDRAIKGLIPIEAAAGVYEGELTVTPKGDADAVLTSRRLRVLLTIGELKPVLKLTEQTPEGPRPLESIRLLAARSGWVEHTIRVAVEHAELAELASEFSDLTGPGGAVMSKLFCIQTAPGGDWDGKEMLAGKEYELTYRAYVVPDLADGEYAGEVKMALLRADKRWSEVTVPVTVEVRLSAPGGGAPAPGETPPVAEEPPAPAP